MIFPDDCLIIIPAYNAAPNIDQLLKELLKTVPTNKILVVDDGSDDNTLQISNNYFVKNISHPVNRGKGTAIYSGLNWAQDNGYDRAITMDADGQHSPKNLKKFTEFDFNSDLGAIVGIRKKVGTQMPWHRKFSNGTTSALISFLAKEKINDCQSGFRLYATKIVNLKSIPKEGKFEWEAKILVVLARANLKIKEVTIDTIYNNGDSHMRLVKDTLRFIKMFLGLVIKR